MKKIPNIRSSLKKLEEKSKKLHDLVHEALKEVAEPNGIDFAAGLKNDFIYSIGCGRYSIGYYSHRLLYMDGSIDLYSMSFDRIVNLVASWTSVEKFKNEIVEYLKK